MKKLNYLLVTALTVLTMAACGSTVEPDPTPAPAPAPNNTTTQTTTQTTNPDEVYDSENQGNAANLPNPEDIILPQEYSVLIVGHRWAKVFDSAIDDYLEFYEDGTWTECIFDYDVNEWIETDYGFVDFNYDDPQYILYSNKTGSQVEAFTYDDSGYLNSTLSDNMYAEDAQMPADLLEYEGGTAGSRYYENEGYAAFAGKWYEIWPDGNWEAYYEITESGEWYCYNNGELINSGYIIIEGSKISFYGGDDDTLRFVGTMTDNENIIDCPGFELERW